MTCDTQRQFLFRAGGVAQWQSLCRTCVEPWLPSPPSACACSDHSVEYVSPEPVGAWECCAWPANQTWLLLKPHSRRWISA